jgi:ribonuclease BN (tRNA processing enzyme)
MHELMFLGTGNAFYDKQDNYQSNVLLTAPSGSRLLIDCGGDARRALAEFNLNHKDINNVFISHLHSDHIGGMEWLALARYFDPSVDIATLYCPENIIESLWNNSLKGGLSCVDFEASLSAFFTPVSCKADEAFEWEGLTLTPIIAFHCPDNDKLMPCYSLLIQSKNQTVFFTADSKFTPEYHMPIFEQADIIFHDCETVATPSGVHAHYHELKTLPQEIKNKMYLYHCSVKNPEQPSEDGFIGYVERGKVFKLT